MRRLKGCCSLVAEPADALEGWGQSFFRWFTGVPEERNCRRLGRPCEVLCSLLAELSEHPRGAEAELTPETAVCTACFPRSRHYPDHVFRCRMTRRRRS